MLWCNKDLTVFKNVANSNLINIHFSIFEPFCKRLARRLKLFKKNTFNLSAILCLLFEHYVFVEFY